MNNMIRLNFIKDNYVLCRYQDNYKIGEIFRAVGFNDFGQERHRMKIISDIVINAPGLIEDWCILILVDL